MGILAYHLQSPDRPPQTKWQQSANTSITSAAPAEEEREREKKEAKFSLAC